MNSCANEQAKKAFTLVELLVVIAIIAMMVAMFLPMRNEGDRSRITECMSNLRQIGLGLLMYAQDNKDFFPWQVSTNQGGTEDLIQNEIAADHFVKLAPYHLATRVFVCPTDKERQVAATNYFGFSNTNLSYFASLNATLALTSSSTFMVLSGDRHLEFNNQPMMAGVFSITNQAALGWTKELHATKDSKQTLGVLLFGDGHGEIVKSPKLSEVFLRQPIVPVQLAIP